MSKVKYVKPQTTPKAGSVGALPERRWSALWSAIWQGILLIVVGYLLWIITMKEGGFSLNVLWILIQQYWPIFLILVGIWVVGSGVIRWYTGEVEEK